MNKVLKTAFVVLLLVPHWTRPAEQLKRLVHCPAVSLVLIYGTAIWVVNNNTPQLALDAWAEYKSRQEKKLYKQIEQQKKESAIARHKLFLERKSEITQFLEEKVGGNGPTNIILKDYAGLDRAYYNQTLDAARARSADRTMPLPLPIAAVHPHLPGGGSRTEHLWVNEYTTLASLEEDMREVVRAAFERRDMRSLQFESFCQEHSDAPVQKLTEIGQLLGEKTRIIIRSTSE